MTPVKVAVACGLVALLVSACGIAPKPEAGTHNLIKKTGYYGHYIDPRIVHFKCLRKEHLHPHEYYTSAGLPAIRVGKPPKGALILFYPDGFDPISLQIQGKDEDAEAIGSSLLFPYALTGKKLLEVEHCALLG